ncbi:SDR family NAD(P)-dependent oxidoreductase [Paenarthrobacter sp.]|uniref:SDR family NAD(P)-dependent oxidoreductase n=1 Tax=Paenarthrobacter sp. TaxID=1931993 RepID=UPI002810C157|nr:SDR family NAD(P)-dependent oxidoreductase [Paenarthrobacter sp.]
MNGRTALVTGATGGLAKAIATALAREGASVVVVGRTEARAEEATRDIRAAAPDATLEPLAGDLSSHVRYHRDGLLPSHESAPGCTQARREQGSGTALASRKHRRIHPIGCTPKTVIIGGGKDDLRRATSRPRPASSIKSWNGETRWEVRSRTAGTGST